MTTAVTTAASTTENDLALLQRYSSHGDEEAFAQIVRRYANLVFSAGYRVLGDRARAEEVAQETFVRLMQKPGAVTRSLVGWLHHTVTQLAIDEARSSSARQRREREYTREVAERAPSSWGELSPYIDEALAEIPEMSRDLLVEHFLNGKSQQDLALRYGTSPSTICRRMKEALEHLREKLHKKGVVVPLAALSVLLLANVVEAAPAALMQELGKMALMSGSRAAPTSVQVTVSGKTLLLASVGGLAVLALLIWALLTCFQGGRSVGGRGDQAPMSNPISAPTPSAGDSTQPAAPR